MRILSKEETQKLDDFISGIKSVIEIDPCSCVNEICEFLDKINAGKLDSQAKIHIEYCLTAESISNFILRVMKDHAGFTHRMIIIDLYDQCFNETLTDMVEFHYANVASSVYNKNIARSVLRKWLAE